MDWIKRNLFFVLGAVVSLALLIFAGYYTFAGWRHKEKEDENLNAQYAELRRLQSQNPHPGFGKVDNVKLAREQEKELRAVLAQTTRFFQPLAPIPAPAPGSTNLTSSQYSAALRDTLSQLNRAAAQASVQLPTDFKFSFTQQLRLLTFAEGSLEPLARQLAEVKAICDVLIKAKVNSLDALQRERVSADDAAGPLTDYLDVGSQSNELAVLTPYEITFRSFSHEIAQVLAGFANSPHGFIVQAINVEPAPSTALEQPGLTPAAPMTYYRPAAPAPGVARSRLDDEAAEAAALRPDLFRYGGPGAAGRTPVAPAPAYAPPPPGYGTPTTVRSATATGLNETQLRVVLRVQIVKLLPKA